MEMLKDNIDLEVKILYLEANDEVLIKRYKETRRKHPLDDKFSSCLHKAIAFEREQLSPLREVADYYIESSYLSTSQLKEEIKGLFLEKNSDSMIIKLCLLDINTVFQQKLIWYLTSDVCRIHIILKNLDLRPAAIPA